MKKTLRLILKYAAAFSIAAVFTWLSLKGVNAEGRTAILQALTKAKYLLLLPVFALMLLSHFLRALRWKQLIRPMGYQPPVFDLLCGVLLGYVANQFIPRAGEIARCTVIAKQQKIPVEKLVGTILAERFFDLLCLLVLSITVFFLQYGILSGYAGEILSGLAANLRNGGFKMVLTLVVFLLVAATAVYFIKRAGKRAKTVYLKLLKGFGEGFNSIRRLEKKGAFLGYTVLIWVCYILSTWFGCFAIAETSHLSISAGVVLLVMGTFGIIVAPGGLGAYPFAIQKTLLLYSINENIALASGWLLMLAQVAFVVIFGTLAYFALRWKNKYYEKHSISSA